MMGNKEHLNSRAVRIIWAITNGYDSPELLVVEGKTITLSINPLYDSFEFSDDEKVLGYRQAVDRIETILYNAYQNTHEQRGNRMARKTVREATECKATERKVGLELPDSAEILNVLKADAEVVFEVVRPEVTLWYRVCVVERYTVERIVQEGITTVRVCTKAELDALLECNDIYLNWVNTTRE